MTSGSNIPSRASDGELRCPRCNTTLTRGLAPFSLKGTYLGRFESLVCPICHYSALTGSGYEQALREAQNYALVGLAEAEPIIEVFDQKMELEQKVISMNSIQNPTIVLYNDKKNLEEPQPTQSGTIKKPILILDRKVWHYTSSETGLASAKELA